MSWPYGAAAFKVATAVLRGLAPPPELKPSEWAEQSVHIPIGNAIPGLISFDNAPYQREPLDLTIDPTCERITLKWGAQVGKTQLALCAQAYRITEDPVSQLMMQPSEGDLQTWLTTKFNPLVEANSELEATIATPRARKGVNNTRMKSYPGGWLMFAWSGSPKTQRGRSAPFIVCDETDGYDRTAEGHPVGLLWERANTFGDQRKLIEISTPTVKKISWIDHAYEQGDQRQFHVACPHCGGVQTLEWSNVKWDKDADGNHLPETAYYECRTDGCVWSDTDRYYAIRNAERLGHGWKAKKPFRGHASFHLSGLYSCFVELQKIVRSFLDKKAANDIQTFVNVTLAEAWEEEAEKVEADALMARAKPMPAKIPAGVALQTCGVDMQEDRLELERVGWGLGEESWSLDTQVFWGDPLKPEVWAQLFEYLDQTFEHETGAKMRIAATCVDTGGSGGLTQAAYEQLRGKQRRNIFAIKGGKGWDKPIASAPSKSRSGKRGRPVTLFTLGVNDAKLVVLRRFLQEKPGPGYCHVDIERDPEWFQQLTAERLVTRFVKGFPVREWKKTRDRNEALDCRVYAYAALKILDPNIPLRMRRLKPAPETRDASEKVGEPTMEVSKKPSKTRRRRARRPRGRGLGSNIKAR
ncbi:Phage terminase large subunit (GpA) [Pelagimonas phthalicica]|uniref:Phage terminase large subunit (GpA) n=1 Tax=Pelagimonas phthalicica TaxID=1037362 RepID=A0A238JBF0_9RHOB|nr:terminase gpA endonuclease subunit [Pelagimonas phthalicica]TDS94193.1 phage terminase large subunit GpA-like protein [Pelagimonas phthalicica]SMX27282.1 Phage terminase large subunit (GpA) [Pelagimonas phthalicica]